MRIRIGAFTVLLLSALLVTGCASSGPVRDINDPTNSLVFGFVDMSEAPTKLTGATVMQVAPPTDKPYWGTAVRDGVFYHARLPAGSYKLSTLYGSHFFKGDYEYGFPRQGSEGAVRIEEPGIYFLGAFKYQPEKSGLFEPGKFSMEPIESPTAAELLKQILDEDPKIQNSVWAERIRRVIGTAK